MRRTLFEAIIGGIAFFIGVMVVAAVILYFLGAWPSLVNWSVIGFMIMTMVVRQEATRYQKIKLAMNDD